MNEKTALYLRVSTAEQAQEGYSITEQEERLTKYVEARGWKLYKVYTDPGFSGAKMERPALHQMINDIEKGRINKVVVYKLDRLSRSQKDTLYLIEDVFNANNVDFISMTENFDTSTPFGKAIIGILSVFAQLEREQIKERMQMGLDARAREGYYHGGPYAPIGYDYVDGELVINEYEAMQVKKIYELAETGIPLHALWKVINEYGYTHKYNDHWSESAIRSVLTTPVYAGRTVWKGNVYEGRHEAIIEPDRFDRMVEYINNRDIGPYRKNPFTRYHLLSGLLYCGNCGAQYYVKQSSVTRRKTTPADAQPNKYYTCYSRGKSSKPMIKDPTCKNKSWNVKALDAIIKEELRKLAVDKEYFNSVADQSENQADNDKSVMEKRLENIDKQIHKLIELYQLDGIDFEMINEKITALNKEKSSLESELDSMVVTAKPLTRSQARKQLALFDKIVDTAETKELRSIIDKLIDAIIIYDDKIEIIWKF